MYVLASNRSLAEVASHQGLAEGYNQSLAEEYNQSLAEEYNQSLAEGYSASMGLSFTRMYLQNATYNSKYIFVWQH